MTILSGAYPVQADGRVIYFDLCRITACFLVLVNHTNSSIFLSNVPSITWFVSLTYFYISKTAVPLFIMISGALLLGRRDSYHKVALRIIRVVAAMVVFSYLYYAASVGYDLKLMADFKKYFLLISRQPITNAFWYLYMYIGILVMSPVLQRMVSAFDKKDFLYFSFWAFVFLGVWPIIQHFYPEFYYSGHLILPVFHAFIALFVAGYYIDRFCSCGKMALAMSVLVFVGSIAASVLFTYNEYLKLQQIPGANGGGYLFFDNIQIITTMAESLSLFYIIKFFGGNVHFPVFIRRAVSFVGKTTFGIYLLGDFFIVYLQKYYIESLAFMHPMPAVFIWETAVFICGFIVTAVLLHVPLLKKIV